MTYKWRRKHEVETVIETVSQKEVQTKEMKDLTWEVRGIGGGGFSDLIQILKKLICRGKK